MMALLSLLISAWGLAWIALSMRRHAGTAWTAAAGARRLRCGGALLIMAAPLPWALVFDAAQVLVTWSLCILPAAGLLVAAALAFLPAALPRLTATRLVA